MSCTSLDDLLKAINETIAEYDYKKKPLYLESLKKQAQLYWSAAERLNSATDALIKQRIKDNGGYTRGVKG